jgi:predicted nucleic acid-binding protein
MGISYLWDTNTVVYYLQQHYPINAEKFIDSILVDSFPIISAITEIELLCWKVNSKQDELLLKKFINDATVIEIESSIKIKTAEIRKQHKIKLPDAIIAATALVFDLTLITRNLSDFKNINDLKTFDPHSL